MRSRGHVVFGAWQGDGYRSTLVVSGMDRSRHQHDLLELVKRPRVAALQSFDVAQGRQGDECDFSGSMAGLAADELDGAWVVSVAPRAHFF